MNETPKTYEELFAENLRLKKQAEAMSPEKIKAIKASATRQAENRISKELRGEFSYDREKRANAENLMYEWKNTAHSRLVVWTHFRNALIEILKTDNISEAWRLSRLSLGLEPLLEKPDPGTGWNDPSEKEKQRIEMTAAKTRAVEG